VSISKPPVVQLEETRRPTAVELELPSVAQAAAAAEHELRTFALMDRDRCCGYFPALAGSDGIISDLPACRAFASRIPSIWFAGYRYQFNFLRLSLVQQSAEASSPCRL
jgi:hypothetical protein